MAITKLSVNPQKITVSGTSENELDFSKFAYGKTALLEWVSGTTIQVSGREAITSDSADLNSTQTKIVLQLDPGFTIKYKGGAGSEVFTVSIVG
jgi:hypothetical protein